MLTDTVVLTLSLRPTVLGVKNIKWSKNKNKKHQTQLSSSL